MTQRICPHCKHLWDRHTGTCQECGCMWPDPDTVPEPPTPPSARDELTTNIENTIWTELERQADDGMGPYIDREMGMVDASGAGLDMTAVAKAVAALFVDDRDDCSWCHSCTAIDGWKQPLNDTDEHTT